MKIRLSLVFLLPASQEVSFVFADLPKALVRLAKNPLYICIIIAMTCNFYLIGFFTFIPKYIQKYYLQTPAVSSLVAGMILQTMNQEQF